MKGERYDSMAENKNRFTKEKGCFMVPGVYPDGVGFNFTFEAPEKARVSLLLYKKNDRMPSFEFPFEENDRVGNVRSMRLRGRGIEKYEYNFSIDGEVVHDPFAHSILGRKTFGEAYPEDPHSIRCGLLPAAEYDWEGTSCPKIPLNDMILYKLHVRGFTRNAGARVKKKGTFAGLIEMIPYLKNLGVNAVELMPVYDFAEVSPAVRHSGMISEKRNRDKVNFWGYTTGYYYAPKRAYCASGKPETEMRDLVKALHKEGMECILEFWFPESVSSVAAVHVLEFWKMYYNIDGFHILGEGLPPAVAMRDGLLADTKLFVSGYDFASFYEGRIPERRIFCEYNQGFQETMRRFLKSDEDMVSGAMFRIKNNSDFNGVVNYMTSQDGFTMNDLVSYNYRHNEENGEDNQDGCSYNYSWNCGIEGPTRKAAVRKIRDQQIRNAFLMELLSQGIPMIYAGDEFGNSQGGNNNAWCQDNSTGWVDWRAAARNQRLTAFVTNAIAFRNRHPILHMHKELHGTDYLALGFPDISFHGERAWYVNVDNASRLFGVMYYDAYGCDRDEESSKRQYVPEDFIYIAYNFHWEDREVALPNLPQNICWKKVIDTAEDYESCFAEGTEDLMRSAMVRPRSILVLEGREKSE